MRMEEENSREAAEKLQQIGRSYLFDEIGRAKQG